MSQSYIVVQNQGSEIGDESFQKDSKRNKFLGKLCFCEGKVCCGLNFTQEFHSSCACHFSD
uniref:Uncharacterized protein n=1 Tax=Magallana gigas TaxID=29159 RepID=K1PIP1_MAGGI